jgi:membrane dipeptidase
VTAVEPSPVRAERFGVFDFGLTAEQEERAARLHAQSVIIDILFQGPCGYRAFSGRLGDEVLGAWEAAPDPEMALRDTAALPVRHALDGRLDDFRSCWEESGITGGNRQFSLDPGELLPTMALAQAQFDRLPWLRKALRSQDFRDAKRDGVRAGFLSTQDTTGIERDTAILQVLHDLGARVIGLTYNTQNYVGSGCTDRADGGLSDFGGRLVQRMDELGLIVDTGHSGRQTTLDACAVSERPVICSHTFARALVDHDRGKSDAEIEAVAATGGVVGVVAVPFFLSTAEDVTVEAMLDHVDHMVRIAGWEHVAIGSDWPLEQSKASLLRLRAIEERIGFRPEHRIDWPVNLVGFDDYRDFPNITRGLVARGHSDEAVRGILGENFLRVFQAVCG